MSLGTHGDPTALSNKLQRLKENDITSFSYVFPATQQHNAVRRTRAIRATAINATARTIGQALLINTAIATGTSHGRLKSLSLRTNNDTLPDQDSIRDILHCLAFSSLKEFSLAGQTVAHVGLYLQALQDNRHSQLQKLSLYCREFPMMDVCQLLLRRKGPSNNVLPCLQSLTLCGNRIQLYSRRYILSSQEIQLLMEALAGTSSLQHLELCLFDFPNYTDYDDPHSDPTTTKHTQNDSLQHLVLKENNMDHTMAVQLVGMFSNLKHLQVLESAVVDYHGDNDDINSGALMSWSPLQEIKCCQPIQLLSRIQTTLTLNPWHAILANSDSWMDLTLCHCEEQRFGNNMMTQVGEAIESRNGVPIESLTMTDALSNSNLQHILRPILTSERPSSLLAIHHLSLKFWELQALPTALAELLVHPKCAVQKLTLDFVGGRNLTNDIRHPLWMALRQNNTLKRLVVKGHGPNVQSHAAFQSLGECLPFLHLEELTLDEGLRESLMTLKCLIALPLMVNNDTVGAASTIRLVKLTLSHIVVCDAMAKYCAQVMKHPGCFLRELAFVDCRFQRKGRELVIDSLAEIPPGTLQDSFQLVVDGGFTQEDGLKLAKVLPEMQLKRLTLHGFRHCVDTKLSTEFLVALSKNTSLECFDIDLEGYSFQSKVLFHVLRNASNHLMSQTSSRRANEGVPPGLWPRVIESFQTKRFDCSSAVYHLLTKNVGILIPGSR